VRGFEDVVVLQDDAEAVSWPKLLESAADIAGVAPLPSQPKASYVRAVGDGGRQVEDVDLMPGAEERPSPQSRCDPGRWRSARRHSPARRRRRQLALHWLTVNLQRRPVRRIDRDQSITDGFGGYLGRERGDEDHREIAAQHALAQVAMSPAQLADSAGHIAHNPDAIPRREEITNCWPVSP